MMAVDALDAVLDPESLMQIDHADKGEAGG